MEKFGLLTERQWGTVGRIQVMEMRGNMYSRDARSKSIGGEKKELGVSVITSAAKFAVAFWNKKSDYKGSVFRA